MYVDIYYPSQKLCPQHFNEIKLQISPVGTYIPKEYYAPGQFRAYLASFEQFLSDVLSILISDDNSPSSYFAKGIKEIVPRVKAFIEIETRIAQVRVARR